MNSNRLMKSNNKNVKQALQLLDGFIPLIIECLPSKYKDDELCKIIYDLMNSGSDELSLFLTYIVYEKENNENNLYNTPFNAFKNLCGFLSSEDTDRKQIKQMSVILSLPSRTIIEKDLKLNIAGINISETIKNCVANNISHECIDKILSSTNIIITKLLSKQIKNLNFNMLYSLIDDLNTQ